MHLISTTVVLVAALVTLTTAAPAPDASNVAVPVDVERIDLADVHLDDQATPVEGAASKGDAAVRDKRTIGPLRQLFPGLSQIVDRKIQQITRVVFRLVGRLVLGGNNNNNSGSGSGGMSSGRKVSITLPTYPPSEDDEDEDEDTQAPTTTEDSATTPSSDGNAIADSSASAAFSASASSSASSADSRTGDASASSAASASSTPVKK